MWKEEEKDAATEKMDIYCIWSTLNIVPAVALGFGSTVWTLMNVISAFPMLTNWRGQETSKENLALSPQEGVSRLVSQSR